MRTIGKVQFVPSVEINALNNCSITQKTLNELSIYPKESSNISFNIIDYNYRKYLNRFSRMRISFWIKYGQWDLDRSFLMVLGDDDRKLASMNFRVLLGDRNLIRIIKHFEKIAKKLEKENSLNEEDNEKDDKELWLKISKNLSLKQLMLFQMMWTIFQPEKMMDSEITHTRLTLKFQMSLEKDLKDPIEPILIKDMEIS